MEDETMRRFTALELRMTAIALHPIVSKITIKHPLGSSQLSSLRLAGSTAGVPTFYHASRRKRHANVLHHRSSRLVFCAVILLSQPSTHIIHVGVPLRIVRSLYIDPPPPGLSRASSVSRSFTDREGMPTPMPCLSGSPSIARNASRTQLSASPVCPCRANDPVPHSASVVRLSTSSTSTRDMLLVHCPLCKRGVGL